MMVLPIAALFGIYLDHGSWLSVLFSAIALAVIFAVMLPSQFRQQRIAKPLLDWVRGQLPTLSATEQQALNAGTVDWDGELFSGQPDWQKLLQYSHSTLSEEERAFLDGPTNELCSKLDDWAITNELFDLPVEVWDFIRQQGFFGLVIPKQYGGHGFSELAHSDVVLKIASRSISAAVTVMVPNSLGPAELLLHYGTEQQKDDYLPKLASGEHIPCFALTSPVAGSDAGAIPDVGVICQGEWEGKPVVGMKVTWNKRYITLAPVATLIGLAIKVYDPDQLLQRNQDNDPVRDLGVTCVMIPQETPGVHSGARHLPMNTVFMNGPTWGTDVFIPLDYVIGGEEMIGQGWTMLLEVLSIGRSISLPAMSASAGKMACLTTGAYAGVREQFGRPISQFEGVQEAMEPIAGYTYMMDCARWFTASMLDRGVKPSVPSAVLKYRNTGLMREVVNHAMDVVAGRAVINGPRNFLAPAYNAIPIAITVEGANILTRSLMVFGQGAIRCHPYIVQEIEAANSEDELEAVEKFDSVFFDHIAHSTGNVLRAFALGLTRGMLEPVPSTGGLQKYYRQLSRFSAAFATLTDISLLTLGGSLKARQRFAGRMADTLSHQYFASAVIKQWHEEGYPEHLRDLVEWSLEQMLFQMQTSLHQTIKNFPVKALRWPLLLLVFPTGRHLQAPNDELGQRVALSIVNDGPVRERLVQDAYVNQDPEDAVGRIIHASKLARATQPLRQRIQDAIDESDADELQDIEMLLAHQREELLDWAFKKQLINEQERAQVSEAMTAIYDVIRVDAFDGEGIKEMAACATGKMNVVERN
jgi:acyl-CoA dehydrogenase